MEDTINKNVNIKSINEKIEKESAFVDLLTMEINKVIIGQKHICLLYTSPSPRDS